MVPNPKPFTRVPPKDLQLTDLGCPDCRGVLGFKDLGKGALSFECQVGHAFLAESLIESKEDQLEEALWTSVELFEEMVLIHGELAARAEREGHAEDRDAHLRRVDRAQQLSRVLREAIGQDGALTRSAK
jgi:two-component system chemotaxis response regulator CheB